jgi:hypothetical protein
MLALGTQAQPINKSIKITQHNMNTLCRYFRHIVEARSQLLYDRNRVRPPPPMVVATQSSQAVAVLFRNY